MSEKPYNPWREFIENCENGDNFFRGGDYRELLEYIDGLLIQRGQAATPPASQESAEEAVTKALEGIDIAKLESIGWQIALCPVCGMSASAFKPDPRIATLTAEVSRLTAELDRSQKECEGLREWVGQLEGNWLGLRQLELIKCGMKIEQARIHAEAQMNTAKVATLSAGEKG